MQRRLTRPKHNRVFGGVCAGLANYLGWEAAKLRIAYVLLSLISAGFPGGLVYVILWYVMPEE